VVEVDRVDVLEIHEVLDVDRPGLLRIERLELLGGDDDVPIRRQLVALDHVLVGHLLARRGIDPLLLDAHAGLVVELVEAHGLARDCAVELDRHVDQPERDRPAPDRARHQRPPVVMWLMVQLLAHLRPGHDPGAKGCEFVLGHVGMGTALTPAPKGEHHGRPPELPGHSRR
jgi:hypothetical protein